MPANRDRSCPDCDKSFSRATGLSRHRLTHTKPADKMVPCPFGCGHSTLQKANMEAHVASIHWKVKHNVCRLDNCGRIFSGPSSLIRHEKNMHKHFRKSASKAAKPTTDPSPLKAPAIEPMISDFGDTWATMPRSQNPSEHNAMLPFVVSSSVTPNASFIQSAPASHDAYFHPATFATSSSDNRFPLSTFQSADQGPIVSHNAPNIGGMVQSSQTSVMAPVQSAPYSEELPERTTGYQGIPSFNYWQLAHFQTGLEPGRGRRYDFESQCTGDLQRSIDQQLLRNPEMGMNTMNWQFPTESQKWTDQQIPIDP